MLNKRTKKVTFRALKYLQKAKFFQKNLKSVRAQDIPRIPPPRFAGLGCDPGYPLGISYYSRGIVESQILWL